MSLSLSSHAFSHGDEIPKLYTAELRTVSTFLRRSRSPVSHRRRRASPSSSKTPTRRARHRKLDEQIKGHVLEQAELVGTYARAA